MLRFFQKGFNYSQDGPGNRLVYHLQGCNMHCPWCSNPEGMSGSGKCQEASVDDIEKEILSCRPMFFDGGGVTFTGGEATLQLDTVKEIMERVKEKGVSTALETNGTVKNLVDISTVCDYLMIDLKHSDSNTHKQFTGVPNEEVKQNICELAKRREIHIRIPLIHGFNDTEAASDGFAEFFIRLQNEGGRFDVELLPYHEFGKEKWHGLGLEYTVKNGFVSKTFTDEFKTLLSNCNIKVIKT